MFKITLIGNVTWVNKPKELPDGRNVQEIGLAADLNYSRTAFIAVASWKERIKINDPSHSPGYRSVQVGDWVKITGQPSVRPDGHPYAFTNSNGEADARFEIDLWTIEPGPSKNGIPAAGGGAEAPAD